MSAIEKLLEGDIRLPSPPAIAIRILESIKKGDNSYGGLARIISSDPALAAKTLKVSNSAAYGLSQKIDSIEKAIAVIGENTLKNIALSFVISENLRGLEREEFDFDLFWKRAVTAAIAAELTSTLVNLKPDDAFVIALLQDIGVIISYLCKSDDYAKVMSEKKVTGMPLHVIEKNVFGFDHQEIGSEILKQWGLPESIYFPIAYHHDNKKTQSDYDDRIQLLVISDKISSIYHGSHSVEKLDEIHSILSPKCNQKDVDKIIDEVANRSIEMLSLFEIDPGIMKPYSQILQEANEELENLNLSNEKLLIKYKQEKERAERLAQKLQETNERLKKIALLDGLTGLYNHKHFQDSLGKELNRAIRYERPVSLIMFDIDHFKKVNDSYGHRIGDVALKKISESVQNLVRANDIFARYGGEEFALILPETGLKGAAVLAERIRKDIEQLDITVDSLVINLTISLGVATYSPGGGEIGKTQLLDAADKALYKSKNNGRNRLSAATFGQ